MAIIGQRLPVVGAWRAAVLPMALLLAAACGARDLGPESLRQRTALKGATASPVRELERTAFGVRFSWDVSTPRSWVEYRAQLLDEFGPQFSVITSDGASLVLSRRDGGDTYRLELRPVSKEGGQVRVVFFASAG